MPKIVPDHGPATVLCGDSLSVLKHLSPQSVHCCVTSPPYYGLRDYGTAKWEGGDSSCDHRPPKDDGKSGNNGQYQEHPRRFLGDICRKCGAFRRDSQIGLEQTPKEYVTKLVNVFSEVKRVLRDDGTLWVVIGDSYARGFGGGFPGEKSATNVGSFKGRSSRPVPDGAKSKDLLGIPWMVAFALRDDGWYLRSDIVWEKPNVMPESVKDRPTRSHEYVFLLTKSKKYYYNSEAVKEPTIYGPGSRKDVKKGGFNSKYANDVARVGDEAFRAIREFKNKRSVWTIPTRPFKGAHFAVFPPALVEPCVLAGSPDGGVVLDPFAGSGTTGQVALSLGRKFIGIELNPEYLPLIRQRLNEVQNQNLNGTTHHPKSS